MGVNMGRRSFGKGAGALLAGLLLIGLLAGCSEDVQSVVQPLVEPLVTSLELEGPPSGPLIELDRTYADGYEEKLVVYENRRATLTRSDGEVFFAVEPAIFGKVNQELQLLDFSALQPEYRPEDMCCNLSEFKLVYQGQEVRMTETAVPNDLKALVDQMTGLIAAHPNQ